MRFQPFSYLLTYRQTNRSDFLFHLLIRHSGKKSTRYISFLTWAHERKKILQKWCKPKNNKKKKHTLEALLRIYARDSRNFTLAPVCKICRPLFVSCWSKWTICNEKCAICQAPTKAIEISCLWEFYKAFDIKDTWIEQVLSGRFPSLLGLKHFK